jgi:hypothetical protein
MFTFTHPSISDSFRLSLKPPITWYLYEIMREGCGLELKKLVSSSCRQKILKTLSRESGMNMMNLVRKINSTYNETNRNLKILESEDIVVICYFGRVRWIKLNRENPKTIALLQVLKVLESESNTQYFNS